MFVHRLLNSLHSIVGSVTLLAIAFAAGPAQASDLTRIYRGNDGGALYLRKVGDRVFGFGEHPGQNYAYVLDGKIVGDRITGSWWDVPKGTRTERGTLDLQWSQAGERIVRKGGSDFGPDVLTKIAASQISWPGSKSAGFQSTRTNDLDGHFIGDDGSHHYVREIGGKVVWVGEAKASAGQRPRWVSVFIGDRKGLGISGDFADVPKARYHRKNGRFGVGQLTGKRSFSLSQPGNQRTRKLEPEYAVDFDAFAQAIDRAFRGKVVGFAYAITKGDRIVREGAGGDRRRPPDGSRLPFTVDTQNESASTTKLVTAAIVIRTLEEKKISLDTTVARYLPSCWEKGSGINNRRYGLTLRDLLGHRGLTRPSSCSTNPYHCLRDSVKFGRRKPVERRYENINYTIFRYILPRIRNSKVENVICGGSNSATINQDVSRRYAIHVRDQVLKPLGITTGFQWTQPKFALRYDFSNPSKPGLRPDTTDDYLETGSGGMKWSAHEFGEFLAALVSGKIVSEAGLRAMKNDRLGFDSKVDGKPGGYYTKNGGAGGTQSQAVVFPSGIAAYVTINSDKNGYGPKGRATHIIEAFENALR